MTLQKMTWKFTVNLQHIQLVPELVGCTAIDFNCDIVLTIITYMS